MVQLKMLKVRQRMESWRIEKLPGKHPLRCMSVWSPTWSDCLVDLSKVLLSQHRQMAQARVAERGGAGALGTVVRVVIPPAPAFLRGLQGVRTGEPGAHPARVRLSH